MNENVKELLYYIINNLLEFHNSEKDLRFYILLGYLESEVF